MEGAFPTEWDKILAAARRLGATEACLEASSTLALPGSRPPPALPSDAGGGEASNATVGTNGSGTPEPPQPDNTGNSREEEDGGVDPDDPCAQEAPAAKRQRPPDPPPPNPTPNPQREGASGILSRALRSAAGAMGLQ